MLGLLGCPGNAKVTCLNSYEKELNMATLENWNTNQDDCPNDPERQQVAARIMPL